MAIKTFLRLTKTDRKDSHGNVVLKLARCVFGDDWREIDSVEMISGQGYVQNFRTMADPLSRSGNMEPVPESYFWLREKPSWRGKAWDWSTKWGDGLGACWITISKMDSKVGMRDSFGIHLDANAETAWGSAGCVVSNSKETLTKVIKWWEDAKYAPPHILTVNWGLGTVETSTKALTQKPLPKAEPVKPGEVVVKPKADVPTTPVSSESGSDKSAIISLPWYLWPFKNMLLNGLKYGIIAGLTALAGHIPFVAPFLDQIVAALMQIISSIIQ